MRAALVCVLAAGLAACGYHVAGRGDLLPKDIKTIAIPAFGNVTTSYKLGERIPADLAREFLSRTRYRVVADPDKADMVLRGTLVNLMAFPTVYPAPPISRATGVQVTVVLQAMLTARDGRVLFNRPSMEIRERYEIAIDPKAYFDESEAAADRMSRSVARSLVSAILENF